MHNTRLVCDGSRNGLTFAEASELNKPVSGPRGRVSPRAQVAIVGAGPIGLLAANILGALSVDVVVLEKNETTSGLPKAIVLDDEHCRTLEWLRLNGAIDRHARPFGIHFIAANGKPIVRANGFVTANGCGNRTPISQPVYEKVSLAGLERFPNVTVCYGADLIGFQQSDEGVYLSVKNADGVVSVLHADFVLGCDGANSPVRKALGIAFAGRRIDQPHLVVDLAEFPDDAPYSRFYCDPARPFNSIPGPYGGRRIEFMLIDGDKPDEMCSPEVVRELVNRHTPYAGVPLHILRTAVYGFSERVAEKLSLGRSFLLGDAAHVMPPFGAQGLNSGARDAVNLCWKIHGVLNGLWDREVLHTYDSERRSQVEQTIAYSVWVGRLANMQSKLMASLRNGVFAILNVHGGVRRYFSQMRYMPKPKIGPGILLADAGRKNSCVGITFPRIEGLGKGGNRNFDEFVGSGFSLIGIDVSDGELKRLLSLKPWVALAPRVVSLSESTLLSGGQNPLGARMRQLFQVHRGEVLIVRPDRYIGGAMRPADFNGKSQEYADLLYVRDFSAANT